MGKGFSTPRSFRGSGDLRAVLDKNWKGLLTHMNAYIPSYDTDGESLSLPGDVTVGGDITMSSGKTIDGVDPSAHVISDDHTIYPKSDGSRGFTGTVVGVTPTSSSHLATKGYVDDVCKEGFYYRNATQSIPNDTWTAVYWNATGLGESGFSTSSGNMVLANAGYYSIETKVCWASNTSGRRGLRINVAGTVRAQDFEDASQLGYTYCDVSCLYKVSASTTIYIEAYQDRGDSLNLNSGSNVTYVRAIFLGS